MKCNLISNKLHAKYKNIRQMYKIKKKNCSVSNTQAKFTLNKKKLKQNHNKQGKQIYCAQ